MRNRVGTTILEVLFATGIVIVGLIGIASILPVAIRNSTQSNTSAEGLSLGLAWADSFLVRGLHQPTAHSSQGQFTWVWNTGAGWRTYDDGWANVVPQGLGSQFHPTPWYYNGVCIDPNLNFSGLTLPQHRYSVFPFFKDGPPPQPRMLRVGLANSISSISGVAPVSPQVIKNLFSSIDELVADNYLDPNSADENLTGPERESLPARRLFSKTDSNASLRALTNGQYTWMATISRQEPLGSDVSTQIKANNVAGKKPENGLISLLVLHRHDHQPQPDSSVPSAASERLVEVRPLSGNFVGGAGGRVELIGNSLTSESDQIAVGDWIMLGRYYLVDNWDTSSQRRYPFFRWYRIIGLSAEPLADGAGNWTREAVLEGPDFGFATEVVGVPLNEVFPTYGTLVGGVVTVVERQVKLQ